MFTLERTISGGLCSHGPKREDICPDDCPAPLTIFGARQYILGDFHRRNPAPIKPIPTSINLMDAEDVQFLWETFT